ncbi:MAG TPA: hypothetical protein PKW33_10255 [Anaerolineaceae bacterium]|nr:hypothetical protein [Anaerolineaceae bacterium]HPN51958.1 hypothetical protein [Anaerolineaceae bacterium]
MPIINREEIPDLHQGYIRDAHPEIVEWLGRKSLRLSGENASLLVLPEICLEHGQIEVDIASAGAAYAGIAFRIQDLENYELAYAQPHTSGLWDALQYDPVFHGSNTWQLFYGGGAQLAADVPPQTWFRLRVAFAGEQALIQAGEQPPLLVNPLAWGCRTGGLGLWTYLPAFFSNLMVRDDLPNFPEIPATLPLMKDMVTEWFLEGYGMVKGENNGLINLNRYLPANHKEVKLSRVFFMNEDASLILRIGFSDEIDLKVDGQTVFTGTNLFHASPNWNERGYVALNDKIACSLEKGQHRLEAVLRSTEYFGFGLGLAVEGQGITWLPAAFGV